MEVDEEPLEEGAVSVELWEWVGKETTRLKCSEQMPSDAAAGFVGLGAGQGCVLSVISYFISLWEGRETFQADCLCLGTFLPVWY